VRLLLDTHVALWAVTGSASLPPAAQDMIRAADEVFVSVASVWEIAIKHALGKGDMPVSSAQAVQAFADAGYTMLPIRTPHVVHVEQLPPLHHDPFDRLLVAQALTEPLTLITRDRLVAQYGSAIVQVQNL
jgi:PIN domain nuclease of toxin-antitoxin system